MRSSSQEKRVTVDREQAEVTGIPDRNCVNWQSRYSCCSSLDLPLLLFDFTAWPKRKEFNPVLSKRKRNDSQNPFWT